MFIQSSSSSAYDESEYIEAFNQMKRSAGVDEVEDVIERFRTQGQTSQILATQNERAKDDVMKLSQTKEQLQSTWEKVRFAFDSSLNQLLNIFIPRYIGQSEDIEAKEKCADLELDIEDADERKEKADEKILVLQAVEKKIRSNFQDLVQILVDSDETHKSTVSILSVCQDSLETLMKRLAGEDLEEIIDNMEQAAFKPEGDLEVEDTFKEDEEKRRRRALKTDKDDDGLQEEEEIPSSQSIKRQSDMLVSAKQPDHKGRDDRRKSRFSRM